MVQVNNFHHYQADTSGSDQTESPQMASLLQKLLTQKVETVNDDHQPPVNPKASERNDSN